MVAIFGVVVIIGGIAIGLCFAVFLLQLLWVLRNQVVICLAGYLYFVYVIPNCSMFIKVLLGILLFVLAVATAATMDPDQPS